MTTNLLDRVPVDRIRERSRQVDLGRLLVGLLSGIFWLLGWLLGMVVLGGAGWVIAAVVTGWQDAARQIGRPPRAGSP